MLTYNEKLRRRSESDIDMLIRLEVGRSTFAEIMDAELYVISMLADYAA